MNVDAPLACPHCAHALTKTQRQFSCVNGHHFDRAKGGHVHLARTALTTGDTRAMLDERAVALSYGIFDPLYDYLLALAAPVLSSASRPVVADIGAGTGALLARLVDVRDDTVGVALDASVPAARIAERAHPRIQAVVADAWQPLPLLAHSVTVLTSVFAPRNPTSFFETLADDGIVVIVTAGPHHLTELRERFALMRVEAKKLDRLQSAFDTAFVCTHTEALRWRVACDDRLAYAMMTMGPNAHHLTFDRDDVSFTGDVTCDVMVHLFVKRP